MTKLICLISLFVAFNSPLHGQEAPKHKIAIFTPLYLDSVFDAATTYTPNKVFPKFLTPGLDFYLGAQKAVDSLQKRGAPLEFFFFDSKSKPSVLQQMNSIELSEAELVIASSNTLETTLIAEAVRQRKIPFISATLPNDARIVNNPYLVVLSPTLQTHIEGLYKFIQRYYSLENVVVFSKPGKQEDQIKNYFRGYAKSTSALPLNISYVDLPPDFNFRSIANALDSNKKTICISGCMDEIFGMKLVQALGSLKKSYPVTLFGMPTWENFNLNSPAPNDLEIIYTAPFFYNHTNTLEGQIAIDYAKITNGRPSEMFFRGYESTLRFALLLLETKKDIASSLTRKGNLIFTPLDIQPVFKDKKTMVLDYFENKHLYFIKVLGGVKNVLY
ncbi:MAG: hypothetical protein NVS9B7_07090 [Flavisolibacter sp.]